jgi:uncharacterized low-complexity protein
MSNKTINSLRITAGIAFMSSTLAAPLATAADNPFVANDIGSGYQLADSHAEGKCGGDMTAKDAEGTCGEDKAAKDAEGTCGEDKAAKDAEGACGEDKAAKDAEGKCGEGKCGA